MLRKRLSLWLGTAMQVSPLQPLLGCLVPCRAAFQNTFPQVQIIGVDDIADLQHNGTVFSSFAAAWPRLPDLDGDLYYTYEYDNSPIIVDCTPLLPALVGYYVDTTIENRPSTMFQDSNEIDMYPEVRIACSTTCGLTRVTWSNYEQCHQGWCNLNFCLHLQPCTAVERVVTLGMRHLKQPVDAVGSSDDAAAEGRQ